MRYDRAYAPQDFLQAVHYHPLARVTHPIAGPSAQAPQLAPGLRRVTHGSAARRGISGCTA